MRALLVALSALACTVAMQAAEKQLEIFFIDVEGGQATLFVAPGGHSLLIDTGWGYNAYRDANRIAAAAKLAKIKKIDYVLITHYHTDHVGGVPQLIEKIPVGTFIDHGPNRESSKTTETLYSEYQAATSSANHILAKPGEQLPVKGMDVTVVSADGNVLDHSLPGGGQANSFCTDVQQKASDPSENARSVGVVITFGSLKIVDLGDLTWNKELELVCPNNKLGRADIFVVSHHGFDESNSPALVHALQPRVAIMDNGNKKGASPAAWDIVKSSPGLQGLWQLHFADAGGSEHNAEDPFIANVTEADTGYYLKVTADPDGSFRVYNARNKLSKEYPATR
ncbi:MAG: MBL fold metallo-hydrolase [Acidobacteriaceae bacterium]|nr:MBL fold metallo-hydrolase [Acidobacteriaceae bacterium]MBV8573338.1 MBL fold metallo-hydrolase [Acidobacteriaceae bacterium]